MSGLNSLFNRSTLGTRCKTCLNLAISRIKLIRNKREVQLQTMRKEISQYLRTGQEAIARIRVEHVIREQNILAAYEIIELFCEFVLARVPILESKKDCPVELQEAVASIIFASTRCSEVQELIHVRNLFTTKYGKEFVSSILELRPDTSVNRMIIEKLSVKAPSAEEKLSVLKSIAQEYGLDWDSSSTEAQFNKKYDDLLDGSKPLPNESTKITEKPPPPFLLPNEEPSPSPSTREIERTQATQLAANQIAVTVQSDEEPCTNQIAPAVPDALQKARAAIAAAERATATARAAADLARVKLPIVN